jgi:hypothetical protein
MKTYGIMEVYLHQFLISALWRCGVKITPREKNPGYEAAWVVIFWTRWRRNR